MRVQGNGKLWLVMYIIVAKKKVRLPSRFSLKTAQKGCPKSWRRNGDHKSGRLGTFLWQLLQWFPSRFLFSSFLIKKEKLPCYASFNRTRFWFAPIPPLPYYFFNSHVFTLCSVKKKKCTTTILFYMQLSLGREFIKVASEACIKDVLNANVRRTQIVSSILKFFN